MQPSLPSIFAILTAFTLPMQVLAEEKAPWPVFRGNPGMTGVSNEVLLPPLKLKWTFQTERDVIATAVIADGRAYIGSHDEKFYAINLKDGSKAWEYKTEDRIEGSAAIVGSAVVFGSGDGFVYALERADGKLRWKYETEGEVMGGANVFKNPEGKDYVVIGSYDFFLHCIDVETGKAKWKYETDNNVNGAASIADGKVYFGGCDGYVHSVSVSTGEKIDSIEAGQYIANSIVVDAGIAYVANYANEVAAYDLKERKQKWVYSERMFEYFASPSVWKDAVFTASRDKYLYRNDRKTGELKWEFKARKPIDSSPVVSGELVYFGSNDGFLYAVGTEDGLEKWSYEIGESVRSSPAIGGGMLIIGADDGGVYCFESDAKLDLNGAPDNL
jgi:outer membrane protein assembly factor BamB